MSFQYNEEQEKLRIWAKEFAEENILPIAKRVDDQEETSWELVEIMAKGQLFRHLMPKEYGGFGIVLLNLCIIREELARVSIQASDIFIMTILGAYPIIRFGTEVQKQKYLPPLASGEKIGSFALTEPNAGSDIAGIEATAILKGSSYILNGKKCFITNGGTAAVCSVYAKTNPSLGAKGISSFIFNAKSKQHGLTIKITKMVGPGAEYELVFDDFKIPKEDLLGEQGKGMRIALTSLDFCRVTVGAHAVGIAQAAYESALKYSRERKAFGQPLVEFQATQFKLADMVINIQAARLLVCQAASMITIGDEEKTVSRASMAKLFATEMSQRVVDDALQIHGGGGLVSGTRIEQLYRAVRLPRIYEGTSEIQRLIIARAILRGELGSNKS